MPEPILQVKDLEVSFSTREGPVPAVRGVSFEITSGELYGLVGESGSGKSTIAMAVMRYLGINGRARGEVRFRGRNLLELSGEELRRLRGGKISMVYQDPMSSLNPAIPVGDQIAEALLAHSRTERAAASKAAVAMMERMGIPDPAVNARRYVHQLSGGMQQRAVIAMAMICDPELLILDEPTTALDVTTEATILDLVERLKREVQTAILFITHDLGVIARISDRVGVLYAGSLVETGSTRRLFRQPRHPYTLALMSALPRLDGGHHPERLRPIPGRLPDPLRLPPACVFAPRCQFVRPVCQQDPPALREIGPDQLAACHFAESLPGPERAESDPRPSQQRSDLAEVVGVQDLRVHFAERSFLEVVSRRQGHVVRAVDGVSMAVRRHEAVGLVGESGSGKTTLGKVIAGIQARSAGEVRFDGVAVERLDRQRRRELKRKVQFIFQNPESSLNPRQRVADIIARPLRLYGLRRRSEVSLRVRELLDLVQLRPEYGDRYPHQLSGGEKQRVGIARAFAAEPDLIIADEPLSALDVSVQASILKLLADLRSRLGTAYLFISHDLNVVRTLCDRVYVMYLGDIYEVGSTEEVYNPPYHPYTQALLSAVPVPEPDLRRERIRLDGPVPSPRNPPSGCKLHTRCPGFWGEICTREMPPPQEVTSSHRIRCHRPLTTLSKNVIEEPVRKESSDAQ